MAKLIDDSLKVESNNIKEHLYYSIDGTENLETIDSHPEAFNIAPPNILNYNDGEVYYPFFAYNQEMINKTANNIKTKFNFSLDLSKNIRIVSLDTNGVITVYYEAYNKRVNYEQVTNILSDYNIDINRLLEYKKLYDSGNTMVIGKNYNVDKLQDRIKIMFYFDRNSSLESENVLSLCKSKIKNITYTDYLSKSINTLYMIGLSFIKGKFSRYSFYYNLINDDIDDKL